VTDFAAEDFLDARTAGRMQRYNHFALAAAQLAVADGGLDLSGEDRDRCGVIVGCAFGGLGAFEEEHSALLDQGPRRVSPMLIPAFLNNLAPGEIAIRLGLRGINYAVSAACASATHAIGMALRHLQHGEADVILAGGTEAAITPLVIASFCQSRTLATRYNDEPTRASRPFDADRCGFVVGEGAAVLLLETLDHARSRGARVYAELSGFGATGDAHHITAPHPEGHGLARAIELALADAGVRREQVDYVNAHGTSTLLNDKAETRAIKTAFGDRARDLAVSSTKSMIGHLLGAAGAAELVATVLCMEHATVHPTLNYETADPDCDLDYVPHNARPLEIRCAVSNSAGFGGQNSALVVQRI
jgi:3-oxoacyl-[acyl-carrier-protein] synthase II